MHKIEFQDYLEIVNLLQSYVDGLDRGDIDTILAQFAPDALWDFSPSQQRRGHEDIRDFFKDRFSEFALTHHLASPPRLAVQEDGSIHAVTYVFASHKLSDGSPYTMRGRYVDILKKYDGRWLIAQRSVIVHMKEGSNREFSYLKRKIGQPQT